MKKLALFLLSFLIISTFSLSAKAQYQEDQPHVIRENHNQAWLRLLAVQQRILFLKAMWGVPTRVDQGTDIGWKGTSGFNLAIAKEDSMRGAELGANQEYSALKAEEELLRTTMASLRERLSGRETCRPHL